MVISHPYKTIFIHIPRTGGSSIEERDFFSIEAGPTHDALRVVRDQLDGEVYSSYFKFAFVRNPWDWVLSLYSYFSQMTPAHRWYMNNMEVVQKVCSFRNFEEFCINLDWTGLRNDYYHGVCHFLEQHSYITDESGAVAVDYLGRFENLNQDWLAICERIGVDAPLPHLNFTKHGSYRQHYTPEARRAISEHYAKDIELFGYTFE